MRRWAACVLLCALPSALATPAPAAIPAPPADDGWADYPVIVWQDQTPARAAGLRRLGVTALRVLGTRGPLPAAQAQALAAPAPALALALAAGLRFYVENIATDFYAAYHRFHPDHPVTWAFDQARARHARDPADPAAFWRVPSLSDPQALAAVRARLAEHVRRYAPDRPLYYSLADEAGIADLAAAWDFDLAPVALAAMRDWLRGRYGTLAALNAQWGGDFAQWDQVVPMTTTAAIAAPADNFSAWADFKDWMDEAFARAVQAGTDAVHAADPAARAGLEGAQIPGWGGYDYTRLAGAVDVMELYDSGSNVAIARSLNPALAVLTTTAPGSPGIDDAAERARLWHALLLGNRGLIIWDEARALVDAAGRPSPRGLSYGALFAAFRGGLAAQWAASTPPPAPVALLYSPASFRIQWLLDRRQEARQDGQDWTARSAETEGADSPLRASMRQAGDGLTHLGLPARWVSEAMLDGVLHDPATRALLLPQVIALSPEAVAAIAGFASRGGLVLADAAPGWYDAHGRRRVAAPLATVAALVPQWGGLPARLLQAGVPAALAVAQPSGAPASDVELRVLHNGAVRLISLQRAAGTGDVVLSLAEPGYVYDLRRHASLGRLDRLTVPAGPEPSVLAVSPAPLPPLTLAAPMAAQPGTESVVQIGLARPSPAAAPVVHLEVVDPAGRIVAAYSGNAVLQGGAAAWRLRFAHNDPPGRWLVRAADQLGGWAAVCTVWLNRPASAP